MRWEKVAEGVSLFQGSFEHSVDSKGRVSVPSRFRDIIAERYEGKLVLTMDLDKCVTAYPLEEWERFVEKIRALPQSDKAVKDFTRFVFSNAMECELDRQGRVLIPPALREGAGISKSVVLVGIIGKIEIWDSGAWKARQQDNGTTISEALAALGL